MSRWSREAYQLGVKLAADLDHQASSPSYDMSGRLYISDGHNGKPWALLSVPNALVRGVFDALSVTGAELPLNGEGNLNAHITIFRPEEIELLGGPEKLLNDRGRAFHYTLGRLVSFAPEGWSDMSKCWVIRVHSPELQALRRSYGLTSLPNEGKYDFHITVAALKRGVLGRNHKSKDTTAA